MEAENRYEVREVIGKGAFGDVYLVVEKETKHKYVLKRIKMARQSEWQRKATRQEIDIVSRLQHPFIMPYKEHWTHHGHTINVVYGYCEKGDLTTAVAKQKGKPFPEETLRLWLAQLLLAVDYMHRQSVLHRDIKTQNILLTGNGDVQLGDFGLSTVRVSGASAVVIGAAEGGVQPQDDLEPASDVEQQPDVLPKTPEPCDPGGRDAPHGQRLQLKLEPLDKPGGTLNDYALVGTPHFMSPELLSNHKYGYEADIWSLGIVFYELSAMKPPFNAFNLAGLVQKIKRATLPPIPSHYSAEWSTVLKSMLRKDPGRRASPLEILSSPCMAAAVAQARQRALAIDPTVELPVCDTVASLPSDLPSPSCSPLPSPIGSNGTGFSFGSAAAADSFPCSGTPSFPTPPSSGVAVTPTLAHRHEPRSGSSTPDATTHVGRSTVPDLEQAAASRGASLTARPTPAATPSAKASTSSARAQSLPRGTGPATTTPTAAARRHQTPPGCLGLRAAATQPATSAAKGRTSISGAATAATPRTAAAKAAGADERKLASTPSVRRLTSRGGADKDGTRGTVAAVPLQEATPEAAKASPAARTSVSGAVAAGTASALRAAPATTSAVRAELHHGDSRAQGVPSLRSRRGLLDNHIPVVSVPPTPSAPALQASPLPSPEAPRSTRTPDALSSCAGLVAGGEPHAVPDAGGPPTPTGAELMKSPTATYACNGRTPPGKSGVAAGPTAGARPRVSHGGVSHGGGAANRGLTRTAQPQTPPPAAAAAAANAAGPSAGPTPRASRPLAKRPADGTTAAATPRQVVGRVAASPLHVAAGTRRLPSANGAEQQAAQQPEKRLRRVSVSRTNGDAPAGKAPVPAVAVGSNQQTDAAPLPQQAAQPGSAPPNGAAAFVCRAASDGGAGMEEQPSSPARSEGRPGGAENASQPHFGAQALAAEGSDLSIPSGRYPQVDALGNREDTASVRAARTHLWDNQLFLGQAASPGPQLTASGSPRKDDNPCAPGRQSEAYADMLQTAGSGTVDALPRRVSISAFTSCATPLGAQEANVSTQQAPVEVPLHRGSRLAAVLASNDVSSRLSVDVLTPPGFKPLSDEDVTPYGRSTGTPAPSTLVGDSAGTPSPMLPTQQVNAATTRSVPGRDSHSGQSPAASVSESPPSASTPSPCASRGNAQDSGQSHSLAVGNATLGTPLPVPGRLIGAGNHGDGSCDSPSTASAQRSFAGFHVHQPPSPSAWPASTHGLSRGRVTGGACAAATSTDSDAATVSPSPCRLGDVLEAASEGHEEEVQSPLQQHPVAADATGYGVATNTETARLIQLERMVSLCQSLVEEGRLVELVSILSSNLSRQLRVPQGWLQLATAGSDSSGGSGGGNPAAAAAHGRAATGISPVVTGKARRPSGRGPLRTAHQLAAPVGLHHRGPDHGAGARAEADQGGSQVVELGMAARVTAGPLKGAEGVVRFRGPCHWSRGTIIGLELRKPLSATAAAALHAASGDKDSPGTGRRDGLTYFECRPGYGAFVLAEHVATT